MSTYLSQIVDQPVWGPRGSQLGRCTDLLFADTERGYPPLRALVLRKPSGDTTLVAADQIAWLRPSIILKTAEPATYEPRGHEIWLKQHVLDRQVVDVEGRRLVRVNDVRLDRATGNGVHRLVGVEVGTASLLRRLGVEGLSTRLLGALNREPTQRIIPWEDIAPVEEGAPIRLRVTRDRMRAINPVDMADIVAELDRDSGQALIQTLDNEVVADTIQEIDPELQASLIHSLPPERAADVLEEMDPDSAADLLSALSDEARESLLDLMEEEEATDVARLLAYPADSAGGIMTTEFAVVPAGLTAAQALEHLRTSPQAHEDEALYYVHVVDEEGRLRGVISLRDLVMAPPEGDLEAIMETHPVTVSPLTPQNEVARLVARYSLLAVPVVDESGVLQGIVTVDDAIDAIIPTAWKKRLPRFY